MASLHGHLWTVTPRLLSVLRPPRCPPGRAWRIPVHDPRIGHLHLHGVLSLKEGADTLVVMIHGLGGSADSPYMALAAASAESFGFASLRLNMRGARGRGPDFYHAGLTSDLHAVLTSDLARGYDYVYAMGYSLGGHVLLRYLGEHGEGTPLQSAVTICAPLHLQSGCDHLDSFPQRPYLRHVLRGLKRTYEGCVSRGWEDLPVAEANAIQSLRDWDERVVAPRHGFKSAEDYWEKCSAYQVVESIRTETHCLWTEQDPMVPAQLVRPHLRATPHRHDRWLSQGGHVGFSSQVVDGHLSVESWAMRSLQSGR